MAGAGGASRWWIAAVIVGVGVVALLLVWPFGGAQPVAEEPEARGGWLGGAGAGDRSRDDQLGTGDEAGHEPGDDPAAVEEGEAARRITRERWMELVAEIHRARGEGGGEAGGLPPSAERRALPSAEANGSDTPGTLDPQYIQQAVRDVVPLIAECYELAREVDDSLQGRLVMRFTIGGEPDIGGVVEDSAVDEERSELRHPVLDECVRETLYTIELPAPEEGGVVEVSYPFVFSQDDEGR